MKRRAVQLATLVAALACNDTQAPTAPIVQAAKLSADEYEIVDLGLFGSSTQAFSADEAGAVIGRYVPVGDFLTRSFRWTKQNGFEDLGDLNGLSFQVLEGNKHGLLVGWLPTSPTLPPPGQFNVLRPAVRFPHGEIRHIDNADYAGQASGVNKFGVVVGFRNRLPLPSPQSAFMWTSKDGLGLIPLEFERPIVQSAASRINDKGVVLGTVSVRTPNGGCCQGFPFLWDEVRGIRLLPKLSDGQFGVTGLSENEVVVGAGFTRMPLQGERVTNPLTFTPGDVPTHAFRWSATRGLEDLGTLGGRHSVAWGVDDEGNAFGWAMDAAGGQHAVKWTTDGRIIRMGTLGGFAQASDPNKHGVVAGQSETSNGERHGVLFVPTR